MAIRFRCAFCNQLMGIATRKVGTVVRCPKCAQQNVVPATSDIAPSPSATCPAAKTARPAGSATPLSTNHAADAEEFARACDATTEEVPFVELPESADFVPIVHPLRPPGIHLSPLHQLLAVGVMCLLLVAAFLAGLFLGRAQ